MFTTYTSTEVPSYLDAKGVDLLKEGRVHFERLDLQDVNLIRQETTRCYSCGQEIAS